MSSVTSPQAPFIASSEFYLIPANTSPTDSSVSHIPPPTLAKLRTMNLPRMKDMRATGVTTQIISHVPVYANLQSCTRINDALNAAIYMNPDRFAAMASLPVPDGKEAARELQRCVTKYKFVGGVLALGRGDKIDGDGFEELWAAAERYKVPVAVREVWPSLEQIGREYNGNVPASALGAMVASCYTAHTASPVPLIQLYVAGVFDRHPNLRLIISRSGLDLASLFPRIEALCAILPAPTKPSRSFLEVWQHNFYVTTEDVLDMAGFKALLEQIPVDRVLYGANYPFDSERGKALMAELKESGVVGKEEWERIAAGNAEAVFGLKKGKGVRSGY
jgi:predicted TIM-barrel fold metal-dependent hydrolase